MSHVSEIPLGTGGGKINVAKNCLCTPQEFESEEKFSFSIGL